MEKENHEIRFKVTKEEHDKIKEKANSYGMTIKSYLLHLGLKTRLKLMVE